MKTFLPIFVTLASAVFLLAWAVCQDRSQFGRKLWWKQDLQYCSESLKTYRTQHGQYPETLEEWAETDERICPDPDSPGTFNAPWGGALEYRRTAAGWELHGTPNAGEFTLSNHDEFSRWFQTFPDPPLSRVLRGEPFQTAALWILLMSVTLGIGTHFQIRRKTSPLALGVLLLASVGVCMWLTAMEVLSSYSGH